MTFSEVFYNNLYNKHQQMLLKLWRKRYLWWLNMVSEGNTRLILVFYWQINFNLFYYHLTRSSVCRYSENYRSDQKLYSLFSSDLVPNFFIRSTISFIIFWDFSMFYQIFLSPQVKRWRLLLINVVYTSCLTSCRTI